MINRINEVIAYIEKHISDDIDMDTLAQIACSSKYDFQRMFLFFSEMSVSEYIRKRRMTLAGIDLKYNAESVLDTSLKYGYTSPVSFARAFRMFHGINPGEAKKDNAKLRIFPRMIFQITRKEVVQVMRKDRITISGKSYDALYFGESDMSVWSDIYAKREYWRVENAYADVKDTCMLGHVLPYNNYPAINIEEGQVFVIDYHLKKDGSVERKYYLADGTIWENMPSTREFVPEPLQPLRMEKIRICDRDYDAAYYGEQIIGDWSDRYVKREFWRLNDAYEHVKKYKPSCDVLPYNNYPPIKIAIGQAFVIDYHLKKDGSVERRYYLSDGTVWQDMLSTREYTID